MEAWEKQAIKDGLNLNLGPRLNDLLKTLHGHPWVRLCAVCRKDCGTTRMIDLVYVWEPCSCNFVSYVHLVENTYHQKCFKGIA